MSKIEEIKSELSSLLGNTAKLEKYIITHSNLPGPRGNIELAFALSEVYSDMDALRKWTNIDSGPNDPKLMLPFCAAVCLGSLYTKKHNKEIIAILKELAKDPRWRIREGVSFGFQKIGESDFPSLKKIFSQWIKEAENSGKRAILVSLAHPPFLNKETSKFCFQVLEKVLKDLNKDTDSFEVLKKGLDFVISVYTVANPEYGFRFMKKWAGKSETIDSSIRSNLKKKRLLNKFPEEVRGIEI